MKKIAFIDKVHPVLQEGLESMNWICDDLTKVPKSEISDSLANYHGIVIRSRFPMNESILSKAHQLEFIARSGAGMENIDTSYCSQFYITNINLLHYKLSTAPLF